MADRLLENGRKAGWLAACLAATGLKNRSQNWAEHRGGGGTMGRMGVSRRVECVGWIRGQSLSPADGARRWGGRRVAPTASSMVLVLDGDDCSAN